MRCDHGVSYDDFYDIWNADQNTKLYKNEILRYNHLLNLVPDSGHTDFPDRAAKPIKQFAEVMG